MQEILRHVEHRPFPLPRRPWVMAMTWHDVLFAHWPIPPEEMRRHVPEPLELDLYDGKAWMVVAPFHMSRVHPRGVPSVPGLSAFPEINVRTYVKLDGMAGVYFFSLDAGSLAAVWGARAGFRLAYFRAEFEVRPSAEQVRYRSRRLHSTPAEFAGRYGPASPARLLVAGTLEHFLIERYCLYAVKDKRVWRGHIHHVPWPIQDAFAEIERNTMAAAAGIELPATPPLLHFARQLPVLAWWPERVR